MKTKTYFLDLESSADLKTLMLLINRPLLKGNELPLHDMNVIAKLLIELHEYVYYYSYPDNLFTHSFIINNEWYSLVIMVRYADYDTLMNTLREYICKYNNAIINYSKEMQL